MKKISDLAPNLVSKISDYSVLGEYACRLWELCFKFSLANIETTLRFATHIYWYIVSDEKMVWSNEDI